MPAARSRGSGRAPAARPLDDWHSVIVTGQGDLPTRREQGCGQAERASSTQVQPGYQRASPRLRGRKSRACAVRRGSVPRRAMPTSEHTVSCSTVSRPRIPPAGPLWLARRSIRMRAGRRCKCESGRPPRCGFEPPGRVRRRTPADSRENGNSSFDEQLAVDRTASSGSRPFERRVNTRLELGSFSQLADVPSLAPVVRAFAPGARVFFIRYVESDHTHTHRGIGWPTCPHQRYDRAGQRSRRVMDAEHLGVTALTARPLSSPGGLVTRVIGRELGL